METNNGLQASIKRNNPKFVNLSLSWYEICDNCAFQKVVLCEETLRGFTIFSSLYSVYKTFPSPEFKYYLEIPNYCKNLFVLFLAYHSLLV